MANMIFLDVQCDIERTSQKALDQDYIHWVRLPTQWWLLAKPLLMLEWDRPGDVKPLSG